MRQTPLAQLIEAKLGRSLAEHVAKARTDGKDWRSIANDLRDITGVQVSWETLRTWSTDALMVVPRGDADTERASA